MSERGSAAVLLVAVAGVALLLGLALGAVGVLLAERVRASAAADAAALAAAPVTFLPFGAAGTPADEAARFAALNGFALDECDCPVDRSFESRTVRVRVSKVVSIWPIGPVRIEAIGRAEFIPARLLLG